MSLRSDLDKKKLKQKKPLQQLTIIYRDVFRLKSLYEMMHEWVLEEGFTDYNEDKSDSFETFYWERRKPGTSGKDYNIWWRLRKKPEGHRWWTYDLNVDFIGLHIEDSEVMHEGKKIKVNKGEIDIFITPTLHLDIDDEWSEGHLFDSFTKPFRLRMLKKDFSFHKTELESTAARFQSAIKDFLDLKQFSDGQEPYHGHRGLDWD